MIDPGEKIVLLVHRHWFYILKEIIVFFFLSLAPFVLAGLFFEFDVDRALALPGDTGVLVLAVVALWFFFVLPMVFVVWTDYYLDTLIVTDKRIVNIEQRGLFSREVSSFRLDRVQDVTTEVNGIIQTVLQFGIIHVQTAGEAREFIATYVSDPDGVKAAILTEHNRESERWRSGA